MFVGSLRLKGGVHVVKPWQHPSNPDPHHGIVHCIVVHRAVRRLYDIALGNILQLAVGNFVESYASSVLKIDTYVLGIMIEVAITKGA